MSSSRQVSIEWVGVGLMVRKEPSLREGSVGLRAGGAGLLVRSFLHTGRKPDDSRGHFGMVTARGNSTPEAAEE